MNDSSRIAPPSRDPLTLLALAAGLAMGHVVAAMAEQSTAPGLAMPAALVFVACGSAAVLCALAAAPRPRWPAPRLGRWITAIGAGLLGALAPALLF
jgi:multisubunit Na+/H+ antiporter MnhB subunit